MAGNKRENNLKGWLYLLPALLFLGAFMVYPLIDVFIPDLLRRGSVQLFLCAP